MSHSYGYDSMSDLLDAERKRRESEAKSPLRTFSEFQLRDVNLLNDHLEQAREKHPDFLGVMCVLREVADLIKADEVGDKEEIKRQALHVAVTALRLYKGD